MKSCCIIGHRKIIHSDRFKENVNKKLEDLIVNQNVIKFLFGSNSEFNDLCYDLVSKLKEKYPQIIMVFYPDKKEIAFTREDFLPYVNKIKNGKRFSFKVFDEIIEKDVVNHSYFKYSYVVRNKCMIDDCDLCLFYYNIVEFARAEWAGYAVKSGTKIAYEYTREKNKNIILAE